MAEEFDKPSEIGQGPEAEARRWIMELSLADKREKDYRDIGGRIWDRYRGKARKRNSFNILWSNTETLAPAIFSSPPTPDVRRRFKDPDPVGKVAATVLERCLEFQTDTEDFVSNVTMDVLDMLLPGRGVSRIRYVPSLVPGAAAETAEGVEIGDQEELAWEQAVIEHVQWDDFRMGPGKIWKEIPWLAFRHVMGYTDAVEKFGEEIADGLAMDMADDDDLKKDEECARLFRTVEVWEIWSKEDRKVRFICKTYKSSPLKVVDDPLKLTEFWPCARPIYAISDGSTMIPGALYEQYAEQAEELNRISVRINKIVDALKVRGIYDSALGELKELMKASDNELIATQDTTAWAERGGIEKAIWMMPIADAANVLKVLYEQREATKQVIYEISGIADVMRGASDPGETLGAQQLKAKWGGQRVSKMQMEVQRYVRDMIRIMSEIIAERFQPETWLKMTGLQIPTEQQVAMQYQQAMAQAQAQGQQPPPQPQVVTLEQVTQVLRDDAARMFKVDVETDSMIAATMQDDMQGLQEVLGGIAQFTTAIGPAVQAGAFPIEAAKEIVMTIARRSRMGTAVEDALDKMQQPQPQADPNAGKAEAEMAKVQAKQQADQQALQHKAQLDQMALQQNQAMEQQRMQADAQIEQARMAMEQRMQEQSAANDARLQEMQLQFDQQNAMRDADFQRWKALLDADTKVEVAQIAAGASVEAAKERPQPAAK